MNHIASSNKISLLVGSKNPVKINAAKQAISQFFPEIEIECKGVDAPSGVAEQPMTDTETRIGAVNRVKYCQSLSTQTDSKTCELFVAMEGGVDLFEHGPATFAYTVIATQNQLSVGRSALLPLPPSIYNALTEGEELGNVMDRVFNTQNIKQKGGAIGLLTHGRATRESIYTQALILAMAPILNPELYED
ncbi:inosine/xanthosine triphosphatase [Shewanella sp. UCD-KL12]|uniref:inosine/xanthosine triphosphatase n=1 Tax=Shewanella sp. UCD-KL12 TaxID=1917163 RepID=UPI000970D297|nr:inosine/xanthosine triphosphatase [Shewanella sp. UCD-KL12]